MENILFISITLSFLVLMGSHVFYTNSFFLALKNSHQEVWKELGKPQWKIHFGEDNFQNTVKYIRSKQFLSLEDPQLLSIYKKIKNVEYISLSLGLFIVVLTLIDIFKGS